MKDSYMVLACCSSVYHYLRRASKYDYSRRLSDLLMYVEFPEDLGRVEQMLVLKDPVRVSMATQN
jgi:hypothetical protein